MLYSGDCICFSSSLPLLADNPFYLLYVRTPRLSYILLNIFLCTFSIEHCTKMHQSPLDKHDVSERKSRKLLQLQANRTEYCGKEV